jgi:aminoglycoside 2''-phosphotransferase
MTQSAAHLNRIRQRFPEMAFSEIQIDTDGVNNYVLILNNERVFRFPKNEQASKSLEKEAAVLRLLQPRSNLAIPNFDICEEDFVSYPLIAGRALLMEDLQTLPSARQDLLAEQLANFLRQMHTTPLHEVQAAGIGESDVARRPVAWLRLYQEIQRELYPLMLTHIRQWVERLFAPLLADTAWMTGETALINGDIGPYHILYDEARQTINGIIDFGTAGLGDPAHDYAVLLYHYGESFLHRMARFDSRITACLERARFLAAVTELQWALAGIRSKDPSWFLLHFSSARDRLPLRFTWA